MTPQTVTIPEKGKLKLGIFAGLGDFAAVTEATRYGSDHSSDGWGGGSVAKEVATARNGDPALVEASDRIMAALEAINPPSSAFETQRAVVGGVPSVPDFLSGNPMNMRLRRRVERQGAPLAIGVNLVVSSGVDHKTIQRRGAAVLALVRNLAARRPVSLFVMGGMKVKGLNLCPVVQIDTAPLDLARAAWALSAVGCARQMMFRAAEELAQSSTRSINWAFGDYGYSTQSPGIAGDVLRAMGFVEALEVPGVLLGTAFATDAAAAAWVRDTAQTLTE